MTNQPPLLRRAASRAKSAVLTPLPPKLYWHLMGRFRAVPAVTSEFQTIEESIASGQQVVDLLVSLDAITPESVTLHIGSGIGRVENHLAPRVRYCYGVDISPAMVAKARELVRHDNVEFRCTDGRDLNGWEDGSLDLVFSVFVFQHLPRPQVTRYLTEAFAKLRPGGRLVFQLMVDEAKVNKEPPPSHPYALRRYQRQAVTALLDEVGFDGVRAVELDGTPDRLDDEGDVVFVATRPRVRRI